MPCACHLHTSRRTVLRGIGSGALALGLGAAGVPGLADRFEPGAFGSTLETAFDKAGGSALGRLARFTLEPGTMPWDGKLLDVVKGQPVTLLLSGRWYVSRPADLWFEPGVVTMARVGDGALFNPMRNAGNFVADRDGPLGIARSVFELDPEGALMIPADAYTGADGRIEGVAIAWTIDPAEGLRRLGEASDPGGLVALARQRLLVPEVTPEGWENHYHFGESGIFRQSGEEMSCHVQRTVTILTKAIDLPLEPGLTLDWDWWVDELPSLVREDQAATHDYLSIGVKFDDGQDLTYFWSAELPVGHAFRCPLPGWDAIETHLVQRSGSAELGQWLSESRNVTADYHAHIGGPAKRAVSIWLLGVSLFQRRLGVCSYRNVSITGSGQPLQII